MQSFGFGDPIDGLWGAGWAAPGLAPAIAIIGGPGGGRSVEVELEAGSAEGPWRLRGEALELDWTPLEDIEAAATGDALCRVTGRVEGGDELRSVEALGWRQSAPALPETDWESLHQVAAWLSPELGLAVTSVRPRGASNHADALVTGAMLGPARTEVEDPRLSTTYSSDGELVRAGIEVWFARGESDELYPLRAAGEVTGPAMLWGEAGFEVQARPCHWYSHDHQGGGAYLIVRRR